MRQIVWITMILLLLLFPAMIAFGVWLSGKFDEREKQTG